MKSILHLIFVVLFSVSTTQVFAQDAKLTGQLTNENGEALIGANIIVKSLGKGTMSNIEGKYSLILPPGTYEISISYIGYETVIWKNITLSANQTLVKNGKLKPRENNHLNTVVITAQANRQTSTAIVLEQKNASIVFDGISAEQIRKAPDRTSADVLKRVSGATIQDNQFVVVRGLPERYNAAYLNGSPLPSSEPDRKAFSFDIFPSALLNDLKIIKTAMPSLPGDFAGGLISVSTREIPEKNFYQIQVGTNFNAITSFKPFIRSKAGKTDFLGIDDGTRALPNNMPSNEEMLALQNGFEKDKLVQVAQSMPNNYENRTLKAMPGLNLQFTMGNVKNWNKKGENKNSLGSVFALTYNSTPTYREAERAEFDDQNHKMVSYFDKQYTKNVSFGGLWNLALSFARNNDNSNKISLKNLVNINSFDQIVEREGRDYIKGYDIKAYNTLYTQNRLISSQLNGEHTFSKRKVKLDWGLGYSNLNRITPDYRTTLYQRGDSSMPYMIPFSNSVQPNIAGRFFSNQNDHSYNAAADLTIPIKNGSSSHQIKMGSMLHFKKRNFEARQFGYARYKSNSSNISEISQMSIDSVFDSRNMGTEGLLIREVTKLSDTYESEQNTIAGYLQLESSFLRNKLKFIYGVRFESYRQILNTYALADSNPISIDTTVNDFLPSLNIIYTPHSKINLRISASQTVTRPESRELAPFSFYDFGLFALVSGNANLQRTKISNADFRFEYYPKTGQLVSASFFYKYFQNPIEKILFPGVNEGRFFTYINVPKAYTYGTELELRLALSSFMKNNKSRFLDDFALVANAAYMISEVNLDDVVGVEEKRPMQGQSNIIFNGGFIYNDSKHHFSVSFMSNYVGRRIFLVGNEFDPSVWENPRWLLDLTVSKSFIKNKLELKLSIKDLLAQRSYFYEDINQNKKFDRNSDNINFSYKYGQQASFSASYKF